LSKHLLRRVKPHGQDFAIPWHAAPDATVHEVELGVILNGLRADQVSSWQERIGAYCLLLDMGNMDMIKHAITTKTSWTLSKHQGSFLILGELLPPEAIPDPHNVDLLLTVNGETR
jgi:2-keto-4-pentenoate hydratase/2-oxohepta-3-ene-1,7-dioic acid hydratase in catechol pathway